MRPVCTTSQPTMTEEISDLDIKISMGCASKVLGPVTTTDLKDESEEPTNTEEDKELWRQGKEFVAEEYPDHCPSSSTQGGRC